MNSSTVFFYRARSAQFIGLGLCIALLSFSFVEAKALTLAQAQARAEASNPGLKALAERYEAATQRIQQSRALPDPRLQATYFGESIQTRTGPQEAAYSFNQTVPWLSKLGRREDYATSEASALGLTYRNAVLNLRRDVALAYYEAAYLKKALESRQANLQLLSDLQSIVEERVSGGGELNQLLRLNVELEWNEDKLTNLEQQQIVQRARLAALVAESAVTDAALDALTPKVSVGQDTMPNLSRLELAMLANNPELLSLKQSIGSAEFRTELAKLERYPDFTLGLNYIDVGSPILASTPDAGKDPWGVSIAMNLPIWEGKNRAGVREAQAMQRSAEAMYQDRALQMKAALSGAVARRDEAIGRVGRYRDSLLPLADQALENTRSGYESGRLSVLDMIDSERSILDLKLTYWRAVSDLNQAEAIITALTGRIH
jgi:outer membrane protein TolC